MTRLPFGPGPFRMAMGLTAGPIETLVEIDDRYPSEMAERRSLLGMRRAEVFAAEPATDAARAEVLDVLAGVLPRRYPEWFAIEGRVLHNRLTGEAWALDALPHDPLEVAGRLVCEDLCLVDTEAEAGPTLRAAVLCAPSRWRLDEKIGRPLAAVHAPVPLYAERLAGAVDRFMRSLRPGRIAERSNWSVVDDGALFQPVRRLDLLPVTVEEASERLFLRVERQTFMRLPASGMVLFAIRVHSTKLGQAVALPGVADDLAAAVRALPGPLADYKGFDAIGAVLLAYLERGQRTPLGQSTTRTVCSRISRSNTTL